MFYQQYHDIVGLLETHCINSFSSPLANDKIYHSHRIQNNKSNRKFGGISVLVKKSISDGITPFPLLTQITCGLN